MTSANRVAPIRLTRVVSTPDLSPEAMSACAAFGVVPEPGGPGGPPITEPTDTMLGRVRPGEIVLVTGASGAGKSSLLRGLGEAIERRGRRVLRVPEALTDAQSSRAVFDLLTGPARTRAATLALAGLAEPRLWARPAWHISVGECARLRLAMTMHAATPGDVVIADELASSIDRASAYALSRTIRRWVERSGVVLIGASAHEDLEPMLAPDTVIDARSEQARKARDPIQQPVTIGPGTIDDYRALAHLHYRAGKPAAVVKIHRALRRVPDGIDPDGQILAGVLVVSMPTLNASWRARAWPGFLGTGDKSLDASRLNRHVRTISRVIVDPRSRGLGVATKLVRAYLQHPLTAATEARASMGSVCPFFERAGMTPYELIPTIADTRLLDALTHLRLTPTSLMHQRVEPGSLLARELTTWAKSRKLLGRGEPSDDQITHLTPIAACCLCSRPRAYAFVKGSAHDEPEHDDETARAPD